MQQLRWLARAAGLVALAGCATSGVNQGDFNLISIEDEWRLGDQLAQDLQGRLDLVQDREALGYLNRLGERIVSQTELANVPWQFHIVRDPAINAFNIPGGHVYVNTGLFAAADSVAEFAGVLAHEISHGVSRHGTEQLTKQYGLSVLAGLVLGEQPAAYQQILAQVAATGAVAKFSRDDEREADELGVRYMHDAGYDPAGMARMFETLLDQRGEQPGAVEKFFSTHPLTEERISSVRRHAAQLPTNNLVTRDADYQQVRRRLTGR